ncbi:MAG: amidohydrolase [Clostridiales bacterium]|nr:amidohydrolase [Clostridiales bacterium]
MNIYFKNIEFIASDNGIFTVKKGDIFVSGNKIVSVGNKPCCFLPDKTIDGKDKLLIPGLINAHTHVYMSLFRNCADDLLFNDWLFGRIFPMEDKLTEEDQYWGTLLGLCEMIRTGTTSYLDMCIVKNAASRAAAESGIRAVISRGLQGESPDDEGGLRRLNEAKEDIEAFSSGYNGRITFMLAPHAPYTCAPSYVEKVVEEAKKLNIGIHTHLAESKTEIRDIKEKYGITPVELYEKAGMFSVHTAAAHCVNLTDGDIDILRKYNVSVLTNPRSNMKLGNGFAPVKKLMDKGVNVALGTDSAASNNNLNMFKELGYLTLIHKGTAEDAVTVTAQEGFKAATVNGAEALGYKDVGEIREGMKADLAVLDLTCPQMNPRSNLLAALSYSAYGTEVETLIVDGRILMENRELKTIDEERVIFETNKIYNRIK